MQRNYEMNWNDFTSHYGFLIGFVGMVAALVYTFVYRDRYKTLVNDIYVPGNNELRQQLADEKKYNAELEKEVARLTASNDEKETASRQIQNLIRKLPDFSALTDKLTELSQKQTDNHAQVMKSLVGKFDGKNSR